MQQDGSYSNNDSVIASYLLQRDDTTGNIKKNLRKTLSLNYLDKVLYLFCC
jgi:hypothetical protein